MTHRRCPDCEAPIVVTPTGNPYEFTWRCPECGVHGNLSYARPKPLVAQEQET